MVQTKVLEDFPNYIIYSDGRIWSNTSNIFMSLSATPDGYLGTILTNKNGKRVSVKIHRLVALAFIPNPNNDSYVNHKDNNPANNTVSNLEWCTAQYNELYSTHVQHLLHPPQAVEMLDIKTEQVIQEFNTLADAARFLGKEAGHANISACCSGRRKTAYGYKWRKKQ